MVMMMMRKRVFSHSRELSSPIATCGRAKNEEKATRKAWRQDCGGRMLISEISLSLVSLFHR